MPVADKQCKICGSGDLRVTAHTAMCNDCGVLLCYPYPGSDEEEYALGAARGDHEFAERSKKARLHLHLRSGARNHHNFTAMALFALDASARDRRLAILDYGGGGGQFALVVKSLFPLAHVYVADINDFQLLDQYRPLNDQIPFESFADDDTRFDAIFLNDVFEHVGNPLGVLSLLRRKLLGADSLIFVDTPCQFWLYPATRVFSSALHAKLLRGTVDDDHQQIWSRKSFEHVVKAAELQIAKYIETSEFTQPVEFYLDNMHIRSRAIRVLGKLFYRVAPVLAKNKIMATLVPRL